LSETPTPKSRIRRWQLWLGALFVCGLLFLVLLPFGVKYTLAWWLADRTGAEISINDIDLNLFTGEASVTLLKGSGLDQALDIGDSRVDFNWWPLTQKHLLLPSIQVKDLVIDVQRLADGTLNIGGLIIPPSKTDEAAAPALEEEQSLWGIGCQSVYLENVQIHYLDPDLDVRLLIKTLELSDFYSWQPDQSTLLKGDFELNGGGIALDLATTPFAATPVTTGTLAVDKLPLEWLLPLLRESGIEQLKAAISSQLELTLTQPPDQEPQIEVKGKLQVAELDFGLSTPPLTIQQQSFSWKGELSRDQESGLALTGELEGQLLRVLDRERKLNALQLKSYAVTDLVLEETRLIQAAGIRLEQGEFLQLAAADAKQHLLALQQLTLTDLDLRELQHLNIGKVVLAGLDSSLILEQDGRMGGSDWWQAEQPAAAEAKPEPVEATAAEPFTFHIGAIEIGQKSRLGFIDRGPEKPVEMELANLEFTLGTLDSEAAEKPSELKLTGELDRYARLEIAGQIQPLLSPPGLNLEGKLSGLNLPDLNPYIVKVLEGRVLNGQAHADFTAKLKQNLLEAEIELTLAQLETAASRAFETGAEKPPGSLTNMPLSLIKNSNGDVELSLVIEGDLASPDFNTTSLIQQAMLTAIGNAMTASLAPLGVQLLTGVILPPGSTMLASALFDMMNKITIPPVFFAPLENELSAAGQEQIDTLEKLLKDRPGMQLRVCGMASHDDLAAIQQRELANVKAAQAKKNAAAGKEKLTASLTEAQAGYIAFQEELLGLALQRADRVKGVLVEERQIEPKRLFLCDPDIDTTEGGKARVDIRL
jgi:uncharacterized protein involved in outer membrane biogenesis